MNFQSSIFKEATSDEISRIFLHSLQENHVVKATLLDGGMFNTTYHVVYGDPCKEAILRLGPVHRERIMGFEQNLMRAEEYVCDVCRQIGIPSSHILACDTSKTVIDRDYMIVEYIPSVAMVKVNLSAAQRNELCFTLGRYLAKLHQVTGSFFGFVSRILEGYQFASWGEALLFEITDMTDRLQKFDGISAAEADKIKEQFIKHRSLFDEIETPHLMHTDLWAGNVLLDKQDPSVIRAVIDGDRAVFGDPDFEFSSPWMEDKEMQRGYGFHPPAPTEEHRRKRIQLYRMFYLVLEAYVGIGEYNNLDLYHERMAEIRRMINAENDAEM